MNDKLLYHYTSMNACLSMLKNKSLWMSDCRFLNDTKELNEALNIFLRTFSSEEKEILRKAFFYSGNRRNYCIFSLSKKHNVLSQWRAYSDDGKGVAIGFNKDILDRLEFICVDCIYEEHEKFLDSIRVKYKKSINEILTAKKELIAENTFMQWLRLNHSIIDEIVYDLLKVKNKAFEEEHEVRIIKSFSSDELLFRESNNKVIPYKEVVFWKESDLDLAVIIPEIWLGPKCNELNKVSMSIISRLTSFEKYDCGYV